MTLLNSITLSNIRRFAEEVKIEVGPGVTVLLAPNGSGKTALFEAIELALTSGVQRLENRLENLIRDGCDTAKVKLDFGEWSREVLIKNNNVHIVDPGNIEEILGDVKSADIPYLLRLTHLLDQRDRSWFCHQNSTAEAGKQLSILPVGKEAAQVSANVSKAKTALSRALTEADRTVSEKNRARDEWRGAVEKRNSTLSDLGSPLIQISILFQRILNLDGSDKDPLVKTVGALRDLWNSVKIEKSQHKEDLEISIASVSQLAMHPERYVQLTLERTDVERKIKSLQETRRNSDEVFVSIKNGIAQESSAEKILSSELHALKGSADLKRLYQADAAAEVKSNQDKEEAREKERKSLAEFLPIKEALEQAYADQSLYKALDETQTSLRKRADELHSAEQSLVRWKYLHIELTRREDDYSKLLVQVSEEDKLIKSAAIERERQEKSLADARALLNTLTSTQDALKRAVAVIGNSLPLDAEHCPVCLAKHGKDELRERIAVAVAQIDPGISEHANAVRSEEERLLEISQKERNAIVAWTRTQKRQHELVSELNDLRKNIAISRANIYLQDLELEEADFRLRLIQDEIAMDRDNLFKTRQAMRPLLNNEEILNLHQRFASAKNAFDMAVQNRVRADEIFIQLKSVLQSTKYDSVRNIDLTEVQLKVEEVEKRLQDVVNKLRELEQRRADLHSNLLSLDEEIAREESRRIFLSGALSKIVSEWDAAEMIGAPDAEVLVEHSAFLNKRLQDVVAQIAELREIEGEIGRHENASLSNEAQRRVDELRGDMKEEQFSELTELDLRKAEDLRRKIAERRAALEDFASHLADGMENIRDQISGIVPYWQSILRRIIQEPRFSEASLSYFTKWNKTHANVEVKLGNKMATISDVASQAQMTDLQLSFLFAMAVSNKWSPWRALLLDDPTQHHDLVHASGVFDVIRDFVSDHKFQILMTTHDALQARFLMRKLSNDGIPARLWTLEPTLGGVVSKKLAEHTTQYFEPVEAM